MAADEGAQVRQDFANRLKAAMEIMELPPRGRPAWLAKKLGISVTAAQKYLDGSATPRSRRWKAVAAAVQVNVAWLRDNTGTMRSASTTDPLLAELEAVWQKLPPEARADVLWYARQVLERYFARGS